MSKMSDKDNADRKLLVKKMIEKDPAMSFPECSAKVKSRWGVGIGSRLFYSIKNDVLKSKQPELPLKSQPELIDFNALFEHMKGDKSIRSLYIKRDGENFTADITIIPEPITKKVRVKT